MASKVMCKGLTGRISKDWKVIKPITVKEIIDANLPEHSMLPIHQLRRTPCLFSKKNLEREDLLISTERGVYCPGEEIKINIQYKDVTARKMGSIKSRLNKYVLYNPKENRRRYSTKKIMKEVNDDKKLTDKIYQRILTIPVPESAPPTNKLTNAVVLSYIIHLKIDGYPELKVPIIIGTKSFDEAIAHSEMLKQVGEEEQPNLPVDAATPPTNTWMVPSAPPYMSSLMHNSDIPTDFMYPPEYIPENEFDLPPSYDEALGDSAVLTS